MVQKFQFLGSVGTVLLALRNRLDDALKEGNCRQLDLDARGGIEPPIGFCGLGDQAPGRKIVRVEGLAVLPFLVATRGEMAVTSQS